ETASGQVRAYPVHQHRRLLLVNGLLVAGQVDRDAVERELAAKLVHRGEHETRLVREELGHLRGEDERLILDDLLERDRVDDLGVGRGGPDEQGQEGRQNRARHARTPSRRARTILVQTVGRAKGTWVTRSTGPAPPV